MLYDQVKRNKKSQILQREFAKITALKYDWEMFVGNYVKAYNFALGKNKKYINESIEQKKKENNTPNKISTNK